MYFIILAKNTGNVEKGMPHPLVRHPSDHMIVWKQHNLLFVLTCSTFHGCQLPIGLTDLQELLMSASCQNFTILHI